ncbi:MAG: glucose-6-phosphate dehydrogenase [Firmicutes bacterium HGW-Firmicutes-10]|nr:MAG: glucose-6-phosphate dehydrogenase [Firmicutes bacterium HGW-Firmicutes-10]
MNNGKLNKTVFTIFGGTGDLTYRKLLPAFYNLFSLFKMPQDFEILILGRKDYTTESYIEVIKPWLKKFTRTNYRDEVFERMSEHLRYLVVNFTEERDYSLIKDVYEEWGGVQQRLYYLAVAPQFFAPIAFSLKNSGILDEKHSHQVMIEKPFGVDITSAQILHQQMCQAFDDDSIYRIDHYLGKEMIQNIMSVRFNNTLFEGIWNNHQIDNIQISALETVGVENRGAYYDQTGALKDMVQNHLFQILSIVGMEKPLDSSAQAIQSEQVKVLDALVPIEKGKLNEHLILGQYNKGTSGDMSVKGYLEEDNISVDSTTETYVAMKLFVDTPRLSGVPIYIRTGKRCDRRSTEVAIQFKAPQGVLPNLLIIKIYPDEGIYLRFNAKKPGTTPEVVPVFMDFCQSCVYENRINTPEAYERLIEAAFKKDKALFTSWPQVLASWRFIDHLIDRIKEEKMVVYPYPAGQSGPSVSDEMLRRENRHWIDEEHG